MTAIIIDNDWKIYGEERDYNENDLIDCKSLIVGSSDIYLIYDQPNVKSRYMLRNIIKNISIDCDIPSHKALVLE